MHMHTGSYLCPHLYINPIRPFVANISRASAAFMRLWVIINYFYGIMAFIYSLSKPELICDQ